MGNTSGKPHARSRHKKQVHWKAADRPGPPGKPILVSEAESTPDVVTIKWNPPRYDGGSPIIGYLVEHRRYGSPHWVRATPLLVPVPELSLSGLEPGWRYQFRVCAENAVGMSLPGELSELLTVTLQRSAITAPRFVDELKDVIALENEKAEFVANFLGQPSPKLCWFKDGFEIFSSRRIRVITENDRSVLTIHQSAMSDEGEIKCTVTNRAGHAATKAKLTLEAPPSIRLPRQYEDGLLFELGEVIRLKVSIAGRPSPLIFWTHNGESLNNDGVYEIDTSDKYSSLKIEEAQRDHRGEYQIKAVNKLGEDIASFLVTVTDKPSPPGKARVVMTLGRSVTLSWNIPADDGGCKIGNYIVEYYRMGWDVWLKAATCRQLSTVLGDLIEGSEYKFRIKAESPYGVSEPSEESDTIFVPDPKRGMLTPASRGRSLSTDFDPDPLDLKPKPKPRSESSSRVERAYRPMSPSSRPTSPLSRPTTPVSFYDGGIPVRPQRTKTKTPSITPETSPPARRKDITSKMLGKNLLDRASLSRELAYGSPELKFKKHEEDLQRFDDRQRRSEAQQTVQKTVTVIDRQQSGSPTNISISRGTNNPGVDRRQGSPKNPRQHSPEPRAAAREPSPQPRSPRGTAREQSPQPMFTRGTLRERSPQPRSTRSILKEQSPQPASPRGSPRGVHTKGLLREKSPPRNISSNPETSQHNSRFVRSRSPSPNALSVEPDVIADRFELTSPRVLRDTGDTLGGSSEFMLVLFPDEKRIGRGSTSDIKFDFDEDSIPPPISLSAPELGSELPVQQLRYSVSSTELLYERAMDRLYKAATTEANDLINESKQPKWDPTKNRKSVDIPKIQINSTDEDLVGFESKVPHRRRLSAGNTATQHLSWLQRRHSLRNSADFNEEIPENNLHKFPDTLEAKREAFKLRQRSESEEKEEQEFEKIRQRAIEKKEKKKISVVDEEDWDADDPDHEESIPSEIETESSEDERQKRNTDVPYIQVKEEEIYHPGLMISRGTPHHKPASEAPNNRRHPLPDPNFIPKPILKRREDAPKKPVRKDAKGRSFSFFSPPNDKSEGQNNPRNRSFSLTPSRPEHENKTEPLKPENVPTVPPKSTSAIASISGIAAAGVVIPEPLLNKKKGEEEIKVVVDHYGDIVRSYGQRRKSNPKIYLNTEDLKAAAERSSMDSSETESESTDQQNQSEKRGSTSLVRRKSFVEASADFLRSVTSTVSAALTSQSPQNEEVVEESGALELTPTARRGSEFGNSLEVPGSSQRRGSGTLDSSPILQRRGSTHLKRRPSKSPNRLEPTRQKPARSSGSNWSHLRAPPSPQRSPSPNRRNSQSLQARRTSLTTTGRPKMKEITTQTSVQADFPLDSVKQEMTAKAEAKVRTAVDYVTDLCMFLVACWLYLFHNELLAVPVLLVMVYRQLKEEVRKRLPKWLLAKKPKRR